MRPPGPQLLRLMLEFLEVVVQLHLLTRDLIPKSVCLTCHLLLPVEGWTAVGQRSLTFFICVTPPLVSITAVTPHPSATISAAIHGANTISNPRMTPSIANPIARCPKTTPPTSSFAAPAVTWAT